MLGLQARIQIPVTWLLRPGSWPLFHATSFSEAFSVVQGSSLGSPVLSFFHSSVPPSLSYLSSFKETWTKSLVMSDLVTFSNPSGDVLLFFFIEV